MWADCIRAFERTFYSLSDRCGTRYSHALDFVDNVFPFLAINYFLALIQVFSIWQEILYLVLRLDNG